MFPSSHPSHDTLQILLTCFSAISLFIADASCLSMVETHYPSALWCQPIKGWHHPRRRGVTPGVWSYRALLHYLDQQGLMLPPPLTSSEQEKLHQHQSLLSSLFGLPEVWDLLMETITCGRWLSQLCVSTFQVSSAGWVSPGAFLSSISRNSWLEVLLSPVSRRSDSSPASYKGKKIQVSILGQISYHSTLWPLHQTWWSLWVPSYSRYSVILCQLDGWFLHSCT